MVIKTRGVHCGNFTHENSLKNQDRNFFSSRPSPQYGDADKTNANTESR